MRNPWPQLYTSGHCPHHGNPIRLVGRPGTDEERAQCDTCETEWWQSVQRLAAGSSR